AACLNGAGSDGAGTGADEPAGEHVLDGPQWSRLRRSRNSGLLAGASLSRVQASMEPAPTEPEQGPPRQGSGGGHSTPQGSRLRRSRNRAGSLTSPPTAATPQWSRLRRSRNSMASLGGIGPPITGLNGAGSDGAGTGYLRCLPRSEATASMEPAPTEPE